MTIQDLSELAALGPQELLDRSLEEIGDLLRASGAAPVEAAHLETVDYTVRHQVVRLLVRAADEDDLETTYDHLRYLLPVGWRERWPEWASRWRGYADLVATRLSALAAREPAAALGLLHADRILAYVHENPGRSQAGLCDALDLTPPNLSRILGVLEAHELIERRGVGREKHVYPGRLSRAGAAEEPAAGEPPSHRPDGMAGWLSREGAERRAREAEPQVA